MRGVKKSFPPLNVSPDGQTPQRFVDAERDYLADLHAGNVSARTQFDQLDKAKLRQPMYAEQRWLCVYCERRLSEDKTPHVEHWRPLNRAPEFALHWANLFLSCPTADTCDAAKGDRWLGVDGPELPWPTDLAYERLVGYNGRGEMRLRDNAPASDVIRRALELAINGTADHRAILNLNHPTLIAARRAALDQERTKLGRAFAGRTASRADRAARADEILDQDPRPAHVSIRVAWLRKKLGQRL
ncbi:MAG: hypothetical protein OXT64_18710 [Gammaproteobacteria bacterium]|nr:hypothetical protein [Gammaproteobacteria bacterium]